MGTPKFAGGTPGGKKVWTSLRALACRAGFRGRLSCVDAILGKETLMDQALIAYFDERFRETSQVITQQVDARFEQVDARFREVDRQFGEARDVARQTLVLVEDVRHQLQLVAEGYGSLDDRLARVEGNREQRARSVHMDDPVKDLDNRVSILEGWVGRHREVVGESIRKLAAGSPPQAPLPSK